MDETINSKKLYELINKGLLDVTAITRRCFGRVGGIVAIVKTETFMKDLETVTNAGIFDIVEWTCDVADDGTVVLTADLHDRYAGEYIEVLGKVSGGLTVKEFGAELRAVGIRGLA